MLFVPHSCVTNTHTYRKEPASSTTRGKSIVHYLYRADHRTKKARQITNIKLVKTYSPIPRTELLIFTSTRNVINKRCTSRAYHPFNQLSNMSQDLVYRESWGVVSANKRTTIFSLVPTFMYKRPGLTVLHGAPNVTSTYSSLYKHDRAASVVNQTPQTSGNLKNLSGLD